jgi:hypothetical protein
VRLTLDDLSRLYGPVRAVREIHDNPLSAHDGSVPKGTLGEICDIDGCNDIAFVDFGEGAIACVPADLECA